jgi:MFS family permease
MRSQPERSRMRTAWIVVLLGGAVMSISVGLRQGLGLFLPPISMDLSIGRETFALGLGLMNLLWGLAAPFAGALADRWGAARVIFGSAADQEGCGAAQAPPNAPSTPC